MAESVPDLPVSTSPIPLSVAADKDRMAGVRSRIAIVAPGMDILGGQGVQASHLQHRLLGEGYEVMFVPVNPAFPRGLRWVRRIPYLRTLLNEILYICSLHRLRQADVIHVFSASYWSFLLAPVPAMLAARGFRRKVILNYHSGEADDHLTRWGLRVHPWLKLAHEIVVPSEYLQRVFLQHGYQTRVIRNIVNTSAFRFRRRRRLRPALLSVRNLEPHYRVDVILQAYALVKKIYPAATLTVVGYGSEENRLKQLATELQLRDVSFLGRVEQEHMPAVYDAADIFVNASVIDNQPVSILEAFSAGLVVVTTGTGDIRSMVSDAHTGYLVPADDPQALADRLVQVLEQPAAALQAATRGRREVARYAWSCVVNDWAHTYQRQST